MNTCPDCGAKQLVVDPQTGELKCPECGFVVEETTIDTSAEWRAYDERQRLARTRAEPVRRSRATVIGRGGSLSGAKRAEIARLRTLQASITMEERSVAAGEREISKLTAALQLPQHVREEAMRLFAAAQKAGLLRGSSVSPMAVACIVLACREFCLPTRSSELCKRASVNPNEARKSYRKLQRRFDHKLKPPNPRNYVPMVASKLKLSVEVQQMAVEIIRAAGEARVLLGKPPNSMAAAALYISSTINGVNGVGKERGNGRKKREEFASSAEITETTLRKRVKELLRKLDVVVQL